MIPWQNFDGTDHFVPEIVLALTDENVHRYIETGISQLKRGLTSPMLETAHERQFAISQLSNPLLDFDIEHPRRVAAALQQLSDFFERFPGCEIHEPQSPYIEDLHDLVLETSTLPSTPDLEICEDEVSEPASPGMPLTPACIPVTKSVSCLSIADLIHPFDQPIRKTSPLTEPKIMITVDEDMDNLPDASENTLIQQAMGGIRSRQRLFGLQLPRSLKPARMRRPSRSQSRTRAKSIQRNFHALQAKCVQMDKDSCPSSVPFGLSISHVLLPT